MGDLTPAEELRAAARLLRETATTVPYGPPWAVSTDDPNMVVSGDTRPWGAPVVADTADQCVAAWIALMSPALAEPIAAWLETCAGDVASTKRGLDSTGRRPGYSDLEEVDEPDSVRLALAVARSILGRQS